MAGPTAQLTQSAIEILAIDEGTIAQLTQSAIEIVTLNHPHAQLTQSAIEILTLPPPPPPPPPGQPQAPQGVTGSPVGMARCCAKNFWDNCLEDQANLQRQITFPCLCTLPPGLKNKLPWEEQDETGAYPVQSKPWNTLGGIVTPLTAAGDQVVCSFKVPLGYDALFSGMFMGYSGSGYQQGSGDIVWRILVNIHYPDELGNIGYIYGTPQEPLPLTEGQIVFSNSTISLVVNVPNLSGNIQVGASRVFGGLLGFMWPRG